MKTVRDYDFSGKKVLVRCDLDVPMRDGKVVDDFRLRKAVPTLKHILSNASQVIVMGHLGRPEGRDMKYSLRPVATHLTTLLGQGVHFAKEPEDIHEDRIVLLENLRFRKEETENDLTFAAHLAGFADIYVNEAFAVSHREHASIVGIPKYLPGCIGLQFEKELKHLTLDNAEEPIVAMLGGAKLKTKLPAINAMLPRVEKILVGGAMIFTFYRAKGWETGKSLVEEDYVEEAKGLDSKTIVLPDDVVVAENMESGGGEAVPADKIPGDKIGLDIGPGSIEKFKEVLREARTVIWNGPLGYNENPAFAKATNEIANFLSETHAFTITGGGDTVAVLDYLGITEKFDHVSTGGGASLAVLEGKKLPALKALR